MKDEIRLVEPSPCRLRPRARVIFGRLQVYRDHSTAMAATNETTATALRRATKKI
jgi:hypothetical protein